MSQPDDGWRAYMRDRLESAYLAGDNPRAQSGFGGDAPTWRTAREVIADAIDRPGQFLDVGCANGHLMECMVEWCSAGGVAVEPHGLDILASMVALARRRLPEWSDRIHLGDARDWQAPHRYDFVRTELMYAPDSDRRSLVRHLFDGTVASGGRLIVCSYGSRADPDPNAVDLTAQLGAWGFEVNGSHTAVVDGRVLTWAGWIDRR